MHKYFAIIDQKTAHVLILCLVITWLCFQFNFSFNLNVTLFSIAVIFPLVFTIREAFKRRDSIIKLLSIFKSSLNAVYYCFANNNKLSDEDKIVVAEKLREISILFFNVLRGGEYSSHSVREKLNEVYDFVNNHRAEISNGVALKIIRFLKDVHESIENTVGLKMHGTPISLRAYCLVFIYIFPFIFVPTLINDLSASNPLIVYSLACIHGFILISLYNVQEAMENPFDQIGLDDIKLEEFHFEKS
ncbi:MAG: hypothetical protein HOF74_04785 [Gammaproteobacteria bacterium]|jgi:hypothetical protein|nr:hypothetical protein [Gammaproteobacteria bacterium]MBT3859125.1 hypothetical protein [Gammaproteobacteria bacterium]MBT3987125.1 hypothetical protein [Gammaproteobacteria bacterium]MBT4257031.1 hypothetical protein [Gammaproteobacteria bacterium]MBT4580544.1 hypothetical protein [Gammaproteobacteria bacterium]